MLSLTTIHCISCQHIPSRHFRLFYIILTILFSISLCAHIQCQKLSVDFSFLFFSFDRYFEVFLHTDDTFLFSSFFTYFLLSFTQILSGFFLVVVFSSSLSPLTVNYFLHLIFFFLSLLLCSSHTHLSTHSLHSIAHSSPAITPPSLRKSHFRLKDTHTLIFVFSTPPHKWTAI